MKNLEVEIYNDSTDGYELTAYYVRDTADKIRVDIYRNADQSISVESFIRSEWGREDIPIEIQTNEWNEIVGMFDKKLNIKL